MSKLQKALVLTVVFYTGVTLWLLFNFSSYDRPSLVWWCAQIAHVILRYPYVAESADNDVIEKREVSGDRPFLAIILATCFLLPTAYLLSSVLAFADYTLPGWASAIGAILAVLGLWLIWRSHADLGRNWSAVVSAHSEHTLVTEGLYKYVRHPMYVSFFVFYVSQALLIHNWIAGALAPVSIVVLYFIRAGEEDKLMRDTFGAEYDEYCSRTGSVIPKLTTYGSV